MNLLNWDGIDRDSLRDVVGNMRQGGALVEMVGVLFSLEGRGDDYDRDTAERLVEEAGHLLQALGVQALALLDRQAAPDAPTPGDELAARRDVRGG